MNYLTKIIVALLSLSLILFSLTACQQEPFPQANEVKMNISLAMNKFESSNIEEGCRLIIRAILLTLPSTDFPAEIEANILEAKINFEQAGYFNEKGFKLLKKAYNQIKPKTTGINPNQEIGKPASIAPLAENFRNKLLESLNQLRKGNANKVVLILLEAILMIKPGP